jgi:biopolymer transport protein TolQ
MQFTLIDLWAHMGVAARLIAATMLLMSLVSLLIACERLLVLLASRRDSLAFARKLAEQLRASDLDVAAGMADGWQPQGALGKVLSAGLRTYHTSPKHDEDFTFEAVARVLERQAQRELHELKRGIGVLATVASTAPFVGLLGTVLGIVNSFQMMASTGSGGLSAVSSGIAEALATTALGLVVALPAIGAYNGFSALIEARAVDLSEASNELLDLIAGHLRARNEASSVRSSARPRALSAEQ